MDSIPGEDPTLPLEVNSGLNFSRLPDVSGDEVRNQVGGGGALPEVAEETVSPSRARTMKDFENQITELRKENFNLKLRIYFLEDRIQQKFDGPHDDVYRINIELKVELESVKRELQQREQLLRKASKAVESLAQGGDAEIQRLKEDAEKKVQEVEASLTSRIQLLEEDLRTAREEVEKAFALTDRERVQRLAVEQQLSLIITAQAKDIDITALLGEKDRCIEQLRLSLERKNAAIQLLEEGQRRPSEESQDPSAALDDEKEKALEILRTEFSSEKKDLEKRIEGLQENLRDRETELSAEKKNALKRDKTIQGLTLVLKTKENENGELASEIESLKALLAKSGEIGSQAQTQKFKESDEGSQELLMEKESLLADLRSQNLTKDTENRKLQRRLKRTEQELSELLLEKEKLRKDLEEARWQKNQSDKTIHDLQNQLEKTQNELAEKEKAIELHYEVLLSDGDQRLEDQKLVIARLTDGAAQKDELLQTLDGVIREKDLRLQEWSTKFQHLEKNKENLERQNEALMEEKCAAQSEQLVTKMTHELERAKESEYAEMLETLRKEHTVFSTLIKSLKDSDGINNLQEELNTILSLRKQLEEGILETWNLRRTLEEQIRDNRKEEDTPLSWSNQTSYMSICLRDQDHRWDCPVDQLSLEELKKKFVELLGVVKEMHWVIQELKKKPFDFSASDPSGNEKQKSLDTSELLERTEESQTLLGASDEEASVPSCDCPETLSEIIPLDQPYKILNPPELESEPVAGKYFEGSPAVNNCDPRKETSLPVCLLSETGEVEFGSRRQGESKTANEPLDPPKIAGRDNLSNDLENKEEKDLKQLIIQLRAELEQLMQANVALKQQGEPQPMPGHEDAETAGQLNLETELSKVEVKDTATQTMTRSGVAVRPKHEGKRTAVSEYGAATQSSWFDQDCWQRYVSAKSDPQKALPQVGKANKSNSCYQSKKSRLPVLLKASRSLGSISLMTSLPRPDLQPCVFALDQGPKGRQLREEAHQSEAEGHGSIRKDVREEDKQAEASATQPKVFEADLNLPSIQNAGQRDQDHSKAIQLEIEKETPESKRSALPELRPLLGVPEKQYGDAVSLSSGGKRSPSLKQSGLSFDTFDCEAVNDVEDLRRRIRDLKSVVEKYQLLLIQFDLVEPCPPGDALDPVRSDGERMPSPAEFKESEPEFASFSNEMEPKEGVEDSSGSGPSNDQTVQKLRELLSENEAELEKEQMANMKLVDEVHRLHDKLKSLTPRDEPDFSVGPSLPEESRQRQKIHETHNICATYRQHLSNLIRAFEDLLWDNEVDYYVAKSFREKLNQSAQIFERLEHQCLYGEPIDDEMARLCNLAQSLSDLEITQHLPSSEGPTPGKEETESGKGKPTATPTKFPPELLMEHLQEIRLLRQRLEDSIKTNEHLRKQLEQQVSVSVPDQELSFSTLDSPSHCNLLTNKEIFPIPSHCVWADKNGQHILGLIEDYNCLRKQITEGRKQLGKLELPLKEAEGLDSAVTVPLSSLSTTFKAVQQNLEEAARLLNLLWRVSLPMKVVHAAAYSLQDESLKSEVYKLRRKVAEQEKKLYSMARRLYSTNQLKENMERVIIDQLALTHNVLKKARGNLEVQPSDNKAAPSSLIKKRV
ncbi:CDK5 regulatory subunit-associated protein 2 [Pseudonaja textilis]|uniref:CDK5 regulatory subunit-associated protein 2 n=1 Tax=Pseudonaja textilis TaxID=8673 RepID=UPI000EAA77CB|nr:CDK5 regulatory subunit-associated protein 2 [Pseudonaja textilis]